MLQAARLRLVAFDFDGTLIDSAAAIVAGVRACWAACGFPEPDDAAVRRTIGLAWQDSIPALLAGAGETEFAKIRAYHGEIASGRRPRPAQPESLFPGAAEILAELEAADYRLAIVTSRGNARVLQLLEEHGIHRRFVTVKTADHGPAKPNPYLLLQAIAESGAEPGTTVMVGDTVFDMQTARNAGTPAIGVSWGVHPVAELRDAGAHAVIDVFDQLPRLVADLTA